MLIKRSKMNGVMFYRIGLGVETNQSQQKHEEEDIQEADEDIQQDTFYKCLPFFFGEDREYILE